jgi:hypothetical protein
VTFVPAIGALSLEVTVQLGGAGFCQPTCTVAGALLPRLLDATTEYVIVPAVLADALQDAPLELQFVHAKLVGLPLQEAESVTLVLICGLLLLA